MKDERRRIGRVDFPADCIIVDKENLQTFYGKVKDLSHLGVAAKLKLDTPKLLSKEVIIVAETLIMYAEVVREETHEDHKLVALSAKRFSSDVLEYLFNSISTGGK